MKTIILVLAVFLAGGCIKEPLTKVVKYEVLTSKGCKIEYINQFGSTCIDSTQKSVYKALFEVESNEQLIFIKASSILANNAIICRIYIDGKIVKQSTLSGVGSTNVYWKVK